jgi:predicted transcriptional regulator of viral defense system
MRNNDKKMNQKILEKAEKLPYFTVDDFSGLDLSRDYLKIIFSRAEKKGLLIRLKKGVYSSSSFMQKAKNYDGGEFAEFVANVIYEPSYLSFEYVLDKHGMLTESPKKITSATLKKTSSTNNPLGSFYYHHLRPALFTGFGITRAGELVIARATKAKALFDFLYMRKDIIPDESSIRELRLNLDVFSVADKREFSKYIRLEGSEKMEKIERMVFS